MRDVLDAIDRLGIPWFVTGSVAASVYGVLRASQDIDVVLDMDAAGFAALADVLGPSYAIAEPIDYGEFAMASVIDRATAQKVDLILRRGGPFEASAMARRQRAGIPGLGEVWIASVEDLILAKLLWSDGTSELQLRDCEQLWRLNASRIDRAYLDLWAARLGLVDRMARIDRCGLTPGVLSRRPPSRTWMRRPGGGSGSGCPRGRDCSPGLRPTPPDRCLNSSEPSSSCGDSIRRCPKVSLEQVLEQLSMAQAAGTWNGFERPWPLEARD